MDGFLKENDKECISVLQQVSAYEYNFIKPSYSQIPMRNKEIPNPTTSVWCLRAAGMLTVTPELEIMRRISHNYQCLATTRVTFCSHTLKNSKRE